MNARLWTRIALVYLAFSSAQIGFWALFAPRSFYDDFPGLGRTFIAVDGPYNEHLVRDFGALNLALLFVLAAAIVSMSRQLVFTASIASIIWGIPHVIYHATTTDLFTGSDVFVNVGGLVFFVVVALSALFTGSRLEHHELG